MGRPAESDSPQAVSVNVPLATVHGEPLIDVPKDLFIPPDALEVFLETFEGPLDLLLYLIRRKNLDVLNIPIAEITRQYMEYVELMKAVNLTLAADYLVMAAMLAEIKSRMLLPSMPNAEDDESLDPRAELIRRLQEYERYKKAAEDVDVLPRLERDIFPIQLDGLEYQPEKVHPTVDMQDVLLALQGVLKRAEMFVEHQIQKEALSVRERMTLILNRLKGDEFVLFTDLLSVNEGRSGVIVSFLAILELRKELLIELAQASPYDSIYLKSIA